MNNRIFVPGIAIILVVGCLVGAIVVLVQNHNSGGGGGGGGGVASHSKTVTTICQGSRYKNECEDALGSVNSTDPKEYMAVVVKKVMEKVIKATNMSDKLAVQHKSSEKGVKMALDDCKDLLQSAIDSLEASSVLLKGDNARSIQNKTDDLRNWFAMVLSFKETCYDGFDDGVSGEKQVRDTLHTQGGFDGIQKLTAVALDVISGIDNLLSVFNLDLTAVTAPSRRLLEEEEEDPKWLPEADRMLLSKSSDLVWSNTSPNNNKKGANIIKKGANNINAVVAKDGSGDFKTITEAINSYPKNHTGRFTIYVKAGVYKEYPLIDKKKPNIYMFGDGASKTIITGDRCVEPKKEWRTFTSASFGKFLSYGIY